MIRLLLSLSPFVCVYWSQWPVVLWSVYACVSLLTFALYGYDKKQAIKQGWRIPEMILHYCEFFGGWPGALWGQKVFRHKTKKLSFRIWLYVIVFFHMIFWPYFLWGEALLRQLN